MLFYLSSETVRSLALVVLNVALTAYLLRVPRGASAARWLAGFTGATVVYYALRGLEGDGSGGNHATLVDGTALRVSRTYAPALRDKLV